MSIMESKEKFSSILSSVPSKKALVVISSSSVELADPLYDTILQVVLGEELQNYSCIELAAKLVLNAISTCGHVQAGKVRLFVEKISNIIGLKLTLIIGDWEQNGRCGSEQY